MPTLPTLQLKKDEDRRVLSGHLWIFSNELKTPLKGLAPGALVDVESASGTFLARGYANPKTLLCVRLLCRERRPVDRAFFKERFAAARKYRDALLGPRALRREVHGEADYLPGLVVERFGGCIVLQIGSAGMEALLPEILPAIEEVYEPGAVVFAGRGSGREQEGLPERVEVLRGDVPGILWVESEGLQIPVDPLKGQKTGFFLDQEENRRYLAPLSKGARVLDVFSYTGALSLRALAAGASHATLVDSSESALSLAREAMEKNGFSGKFTLHQSDAGKVLKSLAQEKRRFEIVSTDPPAFAKSQKHVREALKAYQETAEAALELVAPAGLYAASSCSHHVDAEEFRKMLSRAFRGSGRLGRIAALRGAAPDHPVHPAMPETGYLKWALSGVE